MPIIEQFQKWPISANLFNQAAAEERREIEEEESRRIAATPRLALRRQALIADEEVKVGTTITHNNYFKLKIISLIGKWFAPGL